MSKFNPNLHHRRSIRLKGYDYSKAGLYFITICVQHRACLFGKIVSGQMILNEAGKMVETEWLALSERYKNIHQHEYVVMPNHFHAILEITDPPPQPPVGATLVVAQSEQETENGQQENGQQENGQQENGQQGNGQPQGNAPTEIAPTGITLGKILGAFQSIVTLKYIRGVKSQGWPPFKGKLLQRNYYEHIIRTEKAYHNISNYIINNPAKWDEDKFYS